MNHWYSFTVVQLIIDSEIQIVYNAYIPFDRYLYVALSIQYESNNFRDSQPQFHKLSGIRQSKW